MKIILGVLVLIVGLAFMLKDQRGEVEVDPREIDLAIRRSDDLDRYRAMFHSATRRLVESRNCTLNEIRDYGGWVRSPNQGGAVYFTYCGAPHVSNRFYLDAETGGVWQ